MTFQESIKELIEQEDLAGRNETMLKKAFEINNSAPAELRWPRESKMWCGGCVVRVFNRLRNYYNHNIKVPV